MISHKHSINANMKPYKICGNSANAYVPIQPILVKYKIQCVSWKVWKKGDDFNNDYISQIQYYREHTKYMWKFSQHLSKYEIHMMKYKKSVNLHEK